MESLSTIKRIGDSHLLINHKNLMLKEVYMHKKNYKDKDLERQGTKPVMVDELNTEFIVLRTPLEIGVDAATGAVLSMPEMSVKLDNLGDVVHILQQFAVQYSEEKAQFTAIRSTYNEEQEQLLQELSKTNLQYSELHEQYLTSQQTCNELNELHNAQITVNTKLNEQISTLENTIVQKETVCDELDTKLIHQKHQIDELINDKTQLAAAIAEIDGRLKAMFESNLRHKEENEHLTRMLQEKDTSIQTLSVQIQLLNSQLNEKKFDALYEFITHPPQNTFDDLILDKPRPKGYSKVPAQEPFNDMDLSTYTNPS